jgi:uncharacterized protein (DUF1015 family)
MMRAVLAVDEHAAAATAGTERVRSQLRSWRSDGLLVRDDVSSFYLYRRADPERVVVGLIAAVSLHPPRHRVVVPHEDVDPVMVGRQVSLMRAFEGHPEPVVTVHRGSDSFRAVIASVLNTAPSFLEHTDAVRHELWPVQDQEEVARLCTELSGGTLLLADGHHRYAAFRRLQQELGGAGSQPGPWDLGLTMLVDDGDTGLRLGPIHRVLPAVAPELVQATPGVRVRGGRDGPCVLTDGKHWWTLDPEPIASRPLAAPWPELVVSLLHREWLPAWAVDPSAVSYVHDADDAVAQARNSGGLALLLPTPTLDAVFDAAASGNLMPAKATSFQPKPLIGLVMRHWPDGAGDL